MALEDVVRGRSPPYGASAAFLAGLRGTPLPSKISEQARYDAIDVDAAHSLVHAKGDNVGALTAGGTSSSSAGAGSSAPLGVSYAAVAGAGIAGVGSGAASGTAAGAHYPYAAAGAPYAVAVAGSGADSGAAAGSTFSYGAAGTPYSYAAAASGAVAGSKYSYAAGASIADGISPTPPAVDKEGRSQACRKLLDALPRDLSISQVMQNTRWQLWQAHLSRLYTKERMLAIEGIQKALACSPVVFEK